MTYEELKNRVAEGRNKEDDKETETSSYEELKRRVNEKRYEDEVKKVDSSYIDLFVNSTNSFFNSAEEEYNKVSWGNASQSYQNRNNTYQDLNHRSEVIRRWLNANKESLDADTYAELAEYLDYFGTNATSILDSFAQAKEYYGQWATEDEYNAFAAYKKDYDEKASLDLDAAEKEIEELERRREELEGSRQQPASNYLNGSYMLTNQPYAAAQQAPQASPQEQELYELKKLITEKQQYLNLAKRIQEGIELSGAVNNADFNQYSGYVSTESDGGWSKLTSQYGMGYGDLTYEYINGKDSGIRGEIIRKASIYSNKGAMGALDKWTSYNYMDENEIAIYNYYYAKDGKEAAEKYLNSIQDSLNQRAGSAMAGAMDDNTLLELAFGVAAGMDQFESGMEGAWQAITGNADYIPVSSTQYASQMVREDLADAGPKLPEWLGGASLGQVGYDTITTGTNMAPSILASVAIGALNPMAGAAVGKGLMGTSAAGNAYQQKLNDGYSQDQARAYGVMVGASEVLLESLLGGISKMGGGLLPDTIIKNLNSVDNVFAKFATSTGGKLLIKSGSEAIEEGLQEVIEPYLWQAVSGEEASVNFEEALYSALLGFVTGGMFEGGDMMLNTVAQNSQYRADGRTIKGAEGGVDALMALANEVAGATTGGIQKDLAKQTSKVESRASNKNVGRLYDTVQKANDQANAPANQADIAKSLERKGFSSETANDIAAALVASYNGQELTSTQQRLLKSASKNSAVQDAISNIMVNSKSTMGQRSQKIRDFQQNILGDTSRTNPAQQSEVNAPASVKVDAQNENGVESHYEVSTDGKTIDKDGNVVSIKGISSIENGRMVLETEDGGTINASEVTYGNRSEALVYEAVANLEGIIDTGTANKLSKHLMKLGGASSNVYVNGIVQAYTYGYYGYGREAMTGKDTLSRTLTEKQRNVAYGLGQQYRDMKTAADQANVRNATVDKKNATVDKKNATAPDGTEYKKVRFEGEIKKWSEKQKAEVEFIDFIASNFSGNTVHVFESYKNKDGKYVYKDSDGNVHTAPNGIYFSSTGDIYLDLNAGTHGEGLIMNTFAHELYHHIQKRSPAKARALAQFLVKELGYESVEAAVNRQIAKAERTGYGVAFFMNEKGMSRSAAERTVYDRAFSDFVADSLENMFTKGDAVSKLQKLRQQDNTLFNWIKGFIDKWVTKLREFYSNHSAISIEGRQVASLEKFEQIQQMFMEALVDAGENYQAAEVQKNTTESGDVMYMSRDIEDVTEDTVKEDLTQVYNGNNVSAKSYIPLSRTTPFALRYITGYADNLPIIVDKKKAYFDMRDDGKFKEDSSHHYHGMGVDGFLNALEILNDPEYAIREQKKNGHEHFAFLSTNENGEEVCIVFEMAVFKPGNMMNGYPSGYYNLDITEFVATDEWLEEHGVEPGTAYKDYLLSFEGNSIAYDRSIHLEQLEKARNTDVGSAGVAASHINNRAFGDNVAQNGPEVKNESLNPGKDGTIFNENGDPVAHSTDDGTIQLSMRTYEEEGRKAFRDYLNKCVKNRKLTKTEMQEMLDGIEEIYTICKDFKDKYAPFSSWSDAAVVRDTYGKPVFSVVTPNGDYKMNLDFSLVCKKRRTLDAVFNEMSKRGIIDNFELGQKSVVKINAIIRKYGMETACALCFVDAKRFRQASMADQFTSLYNELVLSLVPEDQRSSIDHFNFSGYETIKKVDGGIDTLDNSKLDFSHLDHVLKTYGDGTVEYKAAKYIKTHAEGRKLLLRGDFMSSKGFDAVKSQNPDVLKLYNSKKGTGGPKAAFGDVQYMNEVIQKARWWTPEKAYEVGGVRIQSFSDYVPRMVFDYVQMIYDLAATKLPAHAYTKEALFVKQFGLTGVKINMSLIPAIAEGGIAPGLDANGNYVWAGESFDFETAKEIQNAEGYTENCGTICVGVSDRHIRKLLSDPDIRMVIPYHKSGLNPIVAHMNKIAEFTDYTNKQNTTVKETGSKAEEHFDFNKALHDMGKNADPRAVIQQYFDWCDDRGYNPKFPEFRDHPNYYKLIEDFTLFDKDGKYVPQREVRAVFPKEGAAFGSMKDLIQEGLEEDAIVEGKRESNLSAIVDEIEQTIPKTEDEILEEQVAQADRDLEADVMLSDRDYAPTFYSQMAKVVDGMKQEKFGAASVVSMLRGRGVKVEEIKWSGIEEWLAGKKSVTKTELQEFIAGSMLQIEEDMLTDKEIPYSQEHLDLISKYEAERDIIAENLKSEWKRIVGTDIPITYFGAGLESAVVNNLLLANSEKKGNTEAGYKYKAKRAALQRVIEDGDHYFGFENARQAFREALRNPDDFMKSYEMTSFEKGVFRDFIKAKEAYSKVEGISVEDQRTLKAIAESADRFSNRINKVKTEHRAEAAKYLTKYRGYTIKGGTNYRELLFRIPGSTYSNGAMDVHWERAGVLAHARMQDLNTFLGKMLFIEEIQSDWHNEGHKSGYTSEADLARISEIEDEIAQILTEKDNINQEYDDFLTRYWEEDLSDEEYKQYLSVRQNALMDLSYKQRDLEKELYELSEGNDVPDAPFRDNYHEFVLKRLIRMAAEQDYDSIGWTTADIQSKRWSDEFAEGYRIEYDQDIPKFLNKYGKKWGTRVGKTALDNGTEVWSMAITDEMKESVLTEGQPMYSERDTESVSNRSLLANALEGAAQNEIELNRLQEYKSKISLIEAEERKLGELTQKIRDLSFAKGPKDTKAIRDLQFEATQTANRISTYDKQLLRLEASKPLQNVLDREKKMAYQRAEQKGKEALAAYREKAAKTQRELLDRWQESRKKGIESRQSSYVRGRIKAFKERLESSLLKPTDRRYVPIDLIKAMVEVCGLIDTDTELYNADGSINKAQEKRNLTKEKLQNLKDEYEKLKTHSDPIYAGEFDELVYTYLTELRDKYSGKHLREMSLDELTEMYEILRAIEETLQDARKLIGWGDAENVYEAGDAIVAEQAKITQSRKNGKRNGAQQLRDKSLNLSLSPVRNVERMSGYHGDSYLLKLFKKFEQGIRKKNKFVMDAYKSFEHLTSGKEYDDAIYKEVGGKKYTDVNGRKFGISKMQMMQAILSHEREEANGMNHIENSGFSFADLDMLSKGRLRDAISEEYSHRVPAAVNLVAEFAETLKNDKWCQDYMTAARKFFNGTAKDAINETSIALKHRIIAKDKSYIPFEVDKNFVVREISAENDIQQTINSYGMLKDTKKGASQPLIITGLNNILDRHIDQVGNVYGLAIDVRNFNKVWNVRSIDSVGNDPTVKAAIQRNWGNEGVKHIEQAVQDIQGPRHSEQSALYKKVKSGYIGATFLLNLSVVTKQIGSLYSSTSMLKWRGPLRQVGNLLYTMVNSKKISAEVDKYTATAWMRRQGLSDAELHTLMTEGKKTFVGRLVRKLPTIVNPGKYITAMDHAVALSLWRYAKQDTAKRTGLKGEELLKATAEFYDEVVENTQSMTDVLHRPEIQKRSDVISEAFAMFKTDLYQMAGQLQVTSGRFNANKTKENGLALGRTVYAVAMSAVWAQLMTTVFALLRYKVNQYRDDEDEELTYESWLKRQGFSLAGDLMGYILPIFGSEMVGFFESIMYGESEDIVDSIALTAINDLYDIMITIGSSVKDGEMPDPAQIKKLTIKALQVFGIPANNIIRTYEAIQLHAKDIANGEFLSFEAGVDRSPKHHIHRIVEAMDAGNTDVAAGLFEEAVEETAMGKSEDGSYGKDELNEAKSALKTALADKYKNGEVSKETVEKILSELFGMDEDEIYWTFDKWDYTNANGSSDDYSKYNEFYEAVKTGKNLKAVIKEYTDNGVEMKTLSSQITSHFKPLYIEMSNAEKANIKGYLLNAMTVLGDTREEAEMDIRKWEFEGKYGFAYSDFKQEFIAGNISASDAKSAIMRVEGKTVEDAEARVDQWQYEADYPELVGRITYTQYKRWETDGKPNGVSIELFTDVAEFRDDETSSETKSQEEVAAYINSLPISTAQKDALWCCFWKASTLKKAPWR